MQINLSRTVKRFFEPDTLVPFLIGALFLSVTGNAASDMLKIFFGDDIQGLVKIILGSIIIFIICVWFFGKALNKSPKLLDFSRAKPKKHKGLILLVSREEPCQKAIEHHLPELKYCWLIHSSQSFPIIEKLQYEFPSVTFLEPERLIVNDVFDPIKFADLVRDIYAALPDDCTKEEIIADFTGMTAQASVGMAIASLLMRQTKLQYTPAAIKDGKPTHSLNPIEIVLSEKKMVKGKI